MTARYVVTVVVAAVVGVTTVYNVARWMWAAKWN